MNNNIRDLDIIEEQAALLSRRARELRCLYKEKYDSALPDPDFQQVQTAQANLQGAFMAVIRVTSTYI